MKKMLAALMAAVLLLSCLGAGAVAEEKKLKAVVTIFPIYDWVCQIAGDNLDNLEITMLLDSGADLHNYQPTAMDILKVAQADLFIYVGGESDGWVDKVLAAASNPSLRALNLMEALGDAVKEEAIVEGMEHEHEDHDHEDHEEHDHEEEEHESDEHIWLSLRNAMALAPEIAQAMGACDPANAEKYAANAGAYADQLKALDEKYVQAVAEGSLKTILFGDRFPFRYLADDYGLAYFAAFTGCSAETEASFQTIAFLSRKVDELGLKTVLTIENPKTQLPRAIVQNTQTKDQKILSMNSLQSVTADDLKTGINYLSVMAENLEVLREALQ